jgi:hypothetical protein
VLAGACAPATVKAASEAAPSASARLVFMRIAVPFGRVDVPPEGSGEFPGTENERSGGPAGRDALRFRTLISPSDSAWPQRNPLRSGGH